MGRIGPVIRLGHPMIRIPMFAAALILLAGCADNITGSDNGRWLVSERSGETDYEMAGQVLFPYNSAELSPRAYDLVARVAADAKKRSKTRIEVEGFADTS